MAIPGLQNRIKTDTIDTFESEWQTNLDQFKTLREKYLLYPEVTSASAEWKRVP
jgi:hypothetical protein